MNLMPGDCSEGYYPLYSEAVPPANKGECQPALPAPVSSDRQPCSTVQLCAACNQGFFSPEVNMQCQNCPSGANSAKGSFGIRRCFCPAGKYIKYYEYSKSKYVPPAKVTASKTMKCLKCPNGGECDGEPGSYPFAQEGFWQPRPVALTETITYKGKTKIIPVDKGPRALYECPYEDNCLGGPLSNCSNGHGGHVCGICENDFKMTVEGCKECAGIA